MSTILIGIDASTQSEDAIDFGRRLASASSARVIVVSALPYSDAPSRASSGAHHARLRDDAQQAARAMSDRLEGIAAERVQTKIVANPSPAHALQALAENERAGIIVVGSPHAGRLGRVTPGTTGERLLHDAPCAVAVVPKDYGARAEEPIRRIGVAHDGSDEAPATVAAAIELARALDAELELVGVVTPESYGASPTRRGTSSLTLRTEIERAVQNRLDTVVAGLPSDITAGSVRLAGEPADQLAEHSAGLDVLLVGSRGFGPLRAVLVGGVAGRLMRTVRCPMIVIPRGAEAPLGALFATPAATAA